MGAHDFIAPARPRDCGIGLKQFWLALHGEHPSARAAPQEMGAEVSGVAAGPHSCSFGSGQHPSAVTTGAALQEEVSRGVVGPHSSSTESEQLWTASHELSSALTTEKSLQELGTEVSRVAVESHDCSIGSEFSGDDEEANTQYT